MQDLIERCIRPTILMVMWLINMIEQQLGIGISLFSVSGVACRTNVL